MAGYFYQKTRQYCRAAVARYEGIVKDYPDFDELDLVLLHMAECLHAQGRTAEALPHLGHLLEEFPDSAQADTARSLMEQWEQEAPPPAAPSTLPPPDTSAPAPASPLAARCGSRGGARCRPLPAAVPARVS
jgi:tetratricopeptide (TPR) repeat protein